MKIFVSLGEHERQQYHDALALRLEDSAHRLVGRAEEAEFLVFSPDSPIRDFGKLPELKFVQSIWAGVDSIVGNETLKVPFSRLVDDGLAEGMREYVLGHILADHVQIKKYEAKEQWDDAWLPLAQSKTIGIIGAGTLGQACAEAAMALNFQVMGWSKTPKNLNFPSFTGDAGLREVLENSDYVVTLLPHTAETADIINKSFLDAMKSSAMLINPGRGALLDEQALLEALSSDSIRRAVLDVFKVEPLPADHPFWDEPKILITPHIAAKSRLETALEVILTNIEKVDTGETPLFLVDRSAGY